MKRTLIYGAAAVAVLLIAGVAYVLRPSVEASAPIEAVPLDVPTEPSAAQGVETPVSPDAEPAGDADIAAAPAAINGTAVYVISQADSEVRFSIDELLRNTPTTAIGVTDQIAGEIALNFDDPAASQVGQITVNARTLTTDNTNRNRMIRNEILDTGEFEFIVFTPTAVTGLPEAIALNEEISFQIVGELTIRDITAPAVFDVTASLDSEGRLAGTASAVVLRSDYGLVIPSVPSVADVSDEVILAFDFVAYPK